MKPTRIQLLSSLLLCCLVMTLGVPHAQATQISAYSNFGPGNTYGNFGQTIGGQFINGYRFTSGATGSLSEVAIGIGGSGTFNLTLYTDNAGTLGSSVWSTAGVPVSPGSPNPRVISVLSGPNLALGQSYWLVASGPTASAYWSPNTIGATGGYYHQDSGTTFYQGNAQLGAFAVRVVPEPATLGMLAFGLAGLAYAARKRVRR